MYNFFRNVHSLTIHNVLNVTANMWKENLRPHRILNVHTATIFYKSKISKNPEAFFNPDTEPIPKFSPNPDPNRRALVSTSLKVLTPLKRLFV
jgi:hypothetical protein